MLINLIQKYRTYVLVAGLLILIYFPLFLHLTYMPIRLWDESQVSMNAIQMMHNHHYIVTYDKGKPEMSNTKPPLTIWGIVLFSQILGYSELSLRLPSAIAALILCIFLFLILRKYSRSDVFPFFTVCILITCRGYIRNHVTRTGEYDSMLVLFSTVASIYLFLAVEALQKKDQTKYLFLFFIMLTLAVLTKGVAYLMQTPGLFIYVLIRKKVLPFLTDKAFYAGMAVFLIFGVGYYFLRESMNPGYLKAVWQNDLGGRYAAVNEGHRGPFYVYLTELISWQFINYYLLFPLAFIVGLLFSENRIKRLVLFASISAFSFLLIISLASTKLSHYNAPLFPYLAIIIASIFYGLYKVIKTFLQSQTTIFTANALAFILVCCLLIKPYTDIIASVYFPHGDIWEEGLSKSCEYFQAVAAERETLLTNKLVDNFPGQIYGPPTVIYCYREELAERGKPICLIGSQDVHDNDTLLLMNDWFVQQKLQERFKLETIKNLDKYNMQYVLVKAKQD